MCAVFAPGRVINFGSSRGETYHYDLGGYVGDPGNPWCRGTMSTNRLAAGGRGGGGAERRMPGDGETGFVRSSPGIPVGAGERKGGTRAWCNTFAWRGARLIFEMLLRDESASVPPYANYFGR